MKNYFEALEMMITSGYVYKRVDYLGELIAGTSNIVAVDDFFNGEEILY